MTDLTYRDAVAHYFKAHPGAWIDGNLLATMGGCYAWRSRVSDCRTQLGMTIENRQRKVGRRTVSEYRFVPASLLEIAS
jgi:hypothetical protein